MRSITAARPDRMTIGQISRLTAVNIETIRYYEKAGLLPAPARTAGGRRAYSPEEARRLAFIRRARQLGFALDDVRALLDLGAPNEASCADVYAIASRHLDDIRLKIKDLRRLERSLSDTVARCSRDVAPECAILSALYPADIRELRAKAVTSAPGRRPR